ncbi:hypothetical protein B0I31_102443 [Saccharothrix carnea]|uniref:Uncharacterized protein n=1 Tax=Saccharothrix carnea TaxID=1280637 RepID=A0A2P8IG98_SACCR|nr:hypothetical protein B0I31_102443 [Saccharothrix carnea]
MVLLGAGVAAASPAPAAAPRFTDSFDGAVDLDPTYGLNDGLARRQVGEQRGVTYTRTSGVWYPASAPRPWYSQVNHSNRPGTLSFWLGHSAVRLDAPVVAGADGSIAVRAVVDPVVGDTASGQWASLVLTADRNSSGYATNGEVDLGVLVRSTGVVDAFHGGAAAGRGRAQPDGGRFAVTVTARPGDHVATVAVNDAPAFPVTLSRPFPASPTLFLGAYLDDPNATSTFDDLAVSAVDNSALTPPPDSSVRHFGHFAARLTPALGNHLPEVSGRSNLNHVNISDYARYAPEVLDSCGPASCAVYTGFEFFTGCDAADSPDCRLHPEYAQRWERLAAAVEPRYERVAAFYLLDEPFHHGARSADLATAARAIKARFPGAKVMLVEAGKHVAAMDVPTEVDWVGFDEYCEPVSSVEGLLNSLEANLEPHQQVYLFPRAAPLRACGTAAGFQTDADLARLQWEYLALAERHPRVAGLMTFGLWVEDTPVARLPATLDAHERIMARLIAR